MMAASVAVIATHPFDVVKTRMQTSDTLIGSSSGRVFAHLLRTEGWSVLTRGLGIRLMYLLPGTTIMVTTYDAVKGLLTQHNRMNNGNRQQ